MQFEGNRFCFNKQQRNTNIHILGFFEASKLMGILCLTGIFDTYVYSTLKKKTSFFQNITSNYKHFGQRPGFNEKSHFPKAFFSKNGVFQVQNLTPQTQTVTFHASKWHKVLTARGVDVQLRNVVQVNSSL